MSTAPTTGLSTATTDTTDPAVLAWTEALHHPETEETTMHTYPSPSPVGRLTLATVAVVTILATTLAALLVMMPSADAQHGDAGERTHVPCAQEDSPGPCVWDAKHSGNGAGSSFVRRPAGHYKYVSHKRAHALLFDADGAK